MLQPLPLVCSECGHVKGNIPTPGCKKCHHRIYMRKWAREHREQVHVSHHGSWERGAAKYRTSHKQWVAKNKEYVKQQKRKETVRHLETNLNRLKEWIMQNPERKNAAARKRWKQIRAEVIAGYGGKCVCCGETTNEFLAIDHINGRGKEHRASIGQAFYFWLRDQGFPPEFRLLCHNCNFARGRYGYCPHQGFP